MVAKANGHSEFIFASYVDQFHCTTVNLNGSNLTEIEQAHLSFVDGAKAEIWPFLADAPENLSTWHFWRRPYVSQN